MAEIALIAKECLGFAGTLAMAVPWARDFHRRWKKIPHENLHAKGRMGELLDWLRQEDESWLQRPKPFDLLCMTAGLCLLGGSFLIGIWTVV